jgi:hypothetical protein
VPELSEFHVALGVFGGGDVWGVAESESDARQGDIW